MPDYPGWGKELRGYRQEGPYHYPVGAHANCFASTSELIYVRELAMMDVMERLTDKEEWQEKVFDEETVTKWREEALAIPDKEFLTLAIWGKSQWFDQETGQITFHDDDDMSKFKLEGIMTESTFGVCIQELRSKAKYYEKSRIVPTLDATASVAKSDKLVSKELHNALCHAFDKLKADHEASPDRPSNPHDMLQDPVNPSMYLLVYGRTRGFKEECVGVVNAIEQWAGKGNVIPTDDLGFDPEVEKDSRVVGRHVVPQKYWSETFQWLPSNLAFRDDGGARFTSYINNLHPSKYPDIYRNIEELITTCLPMWDQCLCKGGSDSPEGAGRTEPRMETTSYPQDSHGDNWIPNNAEACADYNLTDDDMEVYESEYSGLEMPLLEFKWITARLPFTPEPLFTEVDYSPKPGNLLIDQYHKSGLQIIIKMASIELTPENPHFPAEGWHIEGQLSEHICATAFYYLDSDNVTDTTISFRMQTRNDIHDDNGPFYEVDQCEFSWLEQVYGIGCLGSGSPCLQNYGHVQTPQGRLLAFPNVFQNCISPFKLIDPTKPGRRRFIALWLVDPTERIISTANIPPQQMSWYVDSILGSTVAAREEALSKLPSEVVALLAEKDVNAITTVGEGKLPVELLDMVREYLHQGKEALPMGVEEARKYQIALMKERGAFLKRSELGWRRVDYRFR